MEIIFAIALGVPFLWWNYHIIKTDIQEERIPNKYLGYLLLLLPLWYIYATYFGYFQSIEIWEIFLQLSCTLVLGFTLFHFKLWGAGDAKYILILGCFIPHIGVITLLGGMAFATLSYLLLYFFWFLIGPNLWIEERRNSVYYSLWKTKKDEYENKQQGKSILISIVKSINLFLVIFIIIRFMRLYIIDYLEQSYDLSVYETSLGIISNPDPTTYTIIAFFIVCILGILLLLRKIYSRFYVFFEKLKKTRYIIGLNILLVILLAGQYIKDPNYMKEKILFILTICLAISIGIRVLLFAYRLVFIMKEEELIDIKDLENGMLVDRNFLLKSFEKSCYMEKEKLSLKDIDLQDIQCLKKIYKGFNAYHKKNKTPGFEEFHYIKIKYSQAFSPFIFTGFLVAIFFVLYTKS